MKVFPEREFESYLFCYSFFSSEQFQRFPFSHSVNTNKITSFQQSKEEIGIDVLHGTKGFSLAIAW